MTVTLLTEQKQIFFAQDQNTKETVMAKGFKKKGNQKNGVGNIRQKAQEPCKNHPNARGNLSHTIPCRNQ